MSDVSPEKWETARLGPKYMKLLLSGWSGWREEISRCPPTHNPNTETPPTQKETYSPTQNPSYHLSLSPSLSLSVSLCLASPPKPAMNLPPSRSREETGETDGTQEKSCFSSTMSSNPWIKRPPTPALKSAACSPRPPLPQKVGYQPSC